MNEMTAGFMQVESVQVLKVWSKDGFRGAELHRKHIGTLIEEAYDAWEANWP